MSRKIGFSTGSIYSWDKSLNKQVQILKKVSGINAIELNYAHICDLDEELSLSSIEFIKSLDYVSVHSPFFTGKRNDFFYENTKETLEILKKLEFIYNQISADMIVFHPNQIKDIEPFKDLKLNFSFENMSFRRGVSIEELVKLLNIFSNTGLILDTAHALTYDKNMIKSLISTFKSKINHIHFSDRSFSKTKNKISSHQQLLHCQDISKFDLLKELDCPIIIEISLKDSINDFNNLNQEFLFVKKYFKE